MTKKERDILIERLEKFIPDAEERAKQLRDEDIAEGKTSSNINTYVSGVLQAKIEILISDLKQGGR